VYQRLDEALAHPQTQSLDLLNEVAIDGKVRRFRRFPARFSKLKPESHTRAPDLGEHTREIALEIGTSSADLEAIYQAGGLRA
jgi:crotonobetainyl-CoA:carnitine CoA-transferase CaiB-like acyl-CoA transferase